jgi:hypothetical protein
VDGLIGEAFVDGCLVESGVGKEVLLPKLSKLFLNLPIAHLFPKGLSPLVSLKFEHSYQQAD